MKKKVLFINTVSGYGSTGKIVENLSINNEYDSLVCFGRKKEYGKANSYQFANFFDNAFGALGTIIFGNSTSICTLATKRLIKRIEEYNPDIINLHNLHGYYLNVEMLLKFLKEYNKPVIYTLHDCWSLTGYCPHFDYIKCEKYKTECKDCPHPFSYPFSIFKQRVNKEYFIKKELFNSIDKLSIVTPSDWLNNIVKSSYLKDKEVITINNGINITKFTNSKKKNNRFTVLCLANFWTKEKGADELNKIIPLLDKDIEVIVVGNNSNLVHNAKTLDRTNNLQELIDLYSSSHVLVNPTLEDTYPTINIEALACGTPVITYRTGGSPEIINEKTGIVVEKGDYKTFVNIINELKNNYYFKESDCLEYAKKYTLNNMKDKYLELFKKNWSNK